MITLPTIEDNTRQAGSSVYYGEHPHWLIAYSVHRDSDCLSESNFETFRKALEELPAVKEWTQSDECPVQIERFHHWAVGWIDYLVIDPACSDAVKLALEFAARLEDYPVLDETDFSDREYELAQECWNDYGRSEYVKALRKELFATRFEDDYFDPFTSVEVEDALGELSNEIIDTLYSDAAGNSCWDYQIEGQGAVFNIKEFVQKTDFDSLERSLVAWLKEDQRSKELTALGKVLGATDK